MWLTDSHASKANITNIVETDQILLFICRLWFIRLETSRPDITVRVRTCSDRSPVQSPAHRAMLANEMREAAAPASAIILLARNHNGPGKHRDWGLNVLSFIEWCYFRDIQRWKRNIVPLTFLFLEICTAIFERAVDRKGLCQ